MAQNRLHWLEPGNQECLCPQSAHPCLHDAFCADSAGGDNGDGLTYAAIGGMLISSLINGREHEWAHTFSPSRQHSTSHIKTALKTIPSMIKENLSDQIYYTKWAVACTKTMKDIEDLVPDSGDVVRDGLSAVAVYKDPQGSIHKMTAVCP